MDEQVILEEYRDEEFIQSMYSEVEYPCVFIDGISTEEELEFFRNRMSDEYSSVPLYLLVEGVPLNAGRLDLTLNSLLALRTIYPYGLTLYKTKDNSVEINLQDAEQLCKFIKL